MIRFRFWFRSSAGTSVRSRARAKCSVSVRFRNVYLRVNAFVGLVLGLAFLVIHGLGSVVDMG
jgi:hypothetical protein